MAEKRKPDYTILLKKEGKKKFNKIELYNSELWGVYTRRAYKYRIRANGRWYPKGAKKFYYKSELRDIIWRSIDL